MNLRDWQKKNVIATSGEIDLLLQIIEKQSEALTFYSNKQSWYNGTDGKPSNCLDTSCIGSDYGDVAKTTQAEVDKLVEKLVGEG